MSALSPCQFSTRILNLQVLRDGPQVRRAAVCRCPAAHWPATLTQRHGAPDGQAQPPPRLPVAYCTVGGLRARAGAGPRFRQIGDGDRGPPGQAGEPEGGQGGKIPFKLPSRSFSFCHLIS